jgi:hypothetical protein
MVSYDHDPDEYWDKVERILDSGGNYVPDISTLFTCGIHDNGATPFNAAMVFAYRAYDVDGNLRDCVLIGSRAADVTAAHADVTTYNTISNPSELANCSYWN